MIKKTIVIVCGCFLVLIALYGIFLSTSPENIAVDSATSSDYSSDEKMFNNIESREVTETFWQRLQTVLEIKDALARTEALINLFRNWVQVDVIDAIKALMTGLSGEDQFAVFTEIFLPMDDPSIGDMLYSMGSALTSENWDIWQPFFRLWFDHFPGKTLLMLSQFYDFDAVTDYLDDLITEWMRREPLLALAWAETLPGENLQVFWTRQLIRGWLSFDSEAALEYVLTNKGNELLPPINVMVAMWAEFEPYTAVKYMLDNKVVLVSDKLGEVLQYLAQQEVARFVELFSQIDTEIFSEEDLDHVLGAPIIALSRQDPLAAVEVLNMVPHSPADLYSKVSGQLAEVDLAIAKAWIETIPNVEGRVNAAAAMMETWADEEPYAAIDWLAQETENTRNGLAHHVARAVAKTAPRQAASYLADTLPGEELTTAIIQSETLSYWAEKDPLAAIDWVAQLPDSEDKSGVVHSAIRNWVQNDAEAAMEWASGVENLTEKKEAVFGAIYGQLGDANNADYAELMDWADTQFEAGVTDLRFEQLAEQWLESDISSAKVWISNSERLSPQQKDALLSRYLDILTD